jgi:uncharacterized LabA/DUF88 family protein
VRPTKIILRSDGSRKGDVDGKLIAETMECAIPQIFDQAILVAGDGDYETLIQALKRRGVRTVVAFRKANTSMNLVSACDEFIELTPILYECAQIHAENRARDASTKRGRRRYVF